MSEHCIATALPQLVDEVAALAENSGQTAQVDGSHAVNSLKTFDQLSPFFWGFTQRFGSVPFARRLCSSLSGTGCSAATACPAHAFAAKNWLDNMRHGAYIFLLNLIVARNP